MSPGAPGMPSSTLGPTGPAAHVPVLELDGVTKRFGRSRSGDGGVTPVEDVSLTVGPGEAVGLVGASGAGKSTVARLVAGLERPDAGVISFEGTGVDGLTRRQRRAWGQRMHLLFQDPYASLPPGGRVAGIVAEPLAIHGGGSGSNARRARRGTEAESDRRARVEQALDSVGLDPATYAGRFSHELSGGERQRVAIARAIVGRPRLIIADEPTQMLDAAIRDDLLALLERLRAAHGIAYLSITHDLAVAERLCDRVAVMNRGRIVETAAPSSLLTTPAAPATRELVRAVERLHRPLAAADG
jgi:peptide/nickel transport system ATP-binding protein